MKEGTDLRFVFPLYEGIPGEFLLLVGVAGGGLLLGKVRASLPGTLLAPSPELHQAKGPKGIGTLPQLPHPLWSKWHPSAPVLNTSPGPYP